MTLRDIVSRRRGMRRSDREDYPLDSFHSEWDDFHRHIGRLFDDMWRGNGRMPAFFDTSSGDDLFSQVDEREDDKAYYIDVELPGLDEDDVEISLSNGVLTIKGEKSEEKEEKEKNFYRKERSFGTFCRQLPIPGEVDDTKIKAGFKKGVLSIELPKTEESRKEVKRIEIKSAG